MQPPCCVFNDKMKNLKQDCCSNSDEYLWWFCWFATVTGFNTDRKSDKYQFHIEGFDQLDSHIQENWNDNTLNVVKKLAKLCCLFYKRDNVGFNSMEVRHGTTKPTKRPVRPAKAQISLIRVFAVRMKKHLVLGLPLSIQRTEQTGRMPRLIWVFAGCTCHFVGFVMRRLI